MTVDVEDYFQVSAFEDQVGPGSWSGWPLRVAGNTDRLLQMFEDHDTRATFFMLGWAHRRVTSQSPEQFREDVRRTRGLLEDAGGVAVIGYRAASYSVSLDTLWALEILGEEGYRYSSSICPIRHDHYGIPGFPRFAFRLESDGILEVPVTTLAVGKKNIPCGGGGWFRLAPYAFSRWAMKRINRNEQQPVVFYLHPWEIDVDQPRIPGISRRARFRHYLNLKHTGPRLEKLLQDFAWTRMDDVFSITRDEAHEVCCA